MFRESGRPLALVALVLALFVPVLIVGGLSLRGLISSSLEGAEQVRTTRALTLGMLELQLDEETGVRGFAATGDRSFLEPYRRARAQMTDQIARVRSAIGRFGTPAAAAAIDDAVATNAQWVASVGEPIARAGVPQALLIQRHGKRLVDHFRAAIARTDAELAARETMIDSDTKAAVNRIVAYVGLATIIVLLLTVGFAWIQARTAKRLEEQRLRAEEERRSAAEFRASYLAEKRIADTLQDAFSQRPLPALPALHFSAMYVPATDEARIGGDWYEALELSQDRVLFAIGDVAGHGLDAAVAMSRARQALVAAALADPEPASVLNRVNAELLRQHSPLVTAVVGYADARSHEFVYSIAGHPPPVLLEPGAEPRLLECGALPLGALAGAGYQSYRVDAAAGALLVLYTDGAVEHSHNVLDGEARLLVAASRALGSGASDPATLIHQTIFDGVKAGDDVAILTIGFSDAKADGFTVSASHATADFAGRLGRARDPGADELAPRRRPRASAIMFPRKEAV